MCFARGPLASVFVKREMLGELTVAVLGGICCIVLKECCQRGVFPGCSFHSIFLVARCEIHNLVIGEMYCQSADGMRVLLHLKFRDMPICLGGTDISCIQECRHLIVIDCICFSDLYVCLHNHGLCTHI